MGYVLKGCINERIKIIFAAQQVKDVLMLFQKV